MHVLYADLVTDMNLLQIRIGKYADQEYMEYVGDLITLF